MSEKKSISFSMRELMPVVIEQLEQGQTVRLTVKGVSMQPYLMNERDSVYLTSPKGRTPQVGDIYMFCRTDGSFAMHRICGANSDGTFDFVGDNQYLTDKNITMRQLAAYVPRAERNGKEISCEKGFLRKYYTARMLMRQKHPRFMQRCAVLASYIKAFFRHPTKIFGWFKKRVGRKDK